MPGTFTFHRLTRLAWLGALAAVIVGSLLPGNSPPIRELAQLHINDKIQHFAAYATLAFLPTIGERQFKRLMYAAFGLIILGVLLEFGQRLSVGRCFEFSDMVADAAGVCIGMAFALPIRSDTS